MPSRPKQLAATKGSVSSVKAGAPLPASDVPAKTYSAPALEKGMDVIELLGTAPQGLTITDIAQRLDRSISELFRVVVVLARRGWLAKDDANDRYRVTYRLLEVAHRATPAQELTYVATPEMHALAETVQQSCHLAVVSGLRGLIVARQESPGEASFAVRVGTQIDLADSCSGHVLLAFMPAERSAEILAAARTVPSGLRDRLTQIRAAGHERIASSRLAAVSDMSCPVFGFDGHVVAALTIPYLVAIDDEPHLSAEETLAALRSTALRISHALGWFPRAETEITPSLSVASPSRTRKRGSA